MAEINPLFENVLKNWRLGNELYRLSTPKDIVATYSVGTDAPEETLHVSELTIAAKSVARELDLLEIHKRRPRRYLDSALERYNKLLEERKCSH